MDARAIALAALAALGCGVNGGARRPDLAAPDLTGAEVRCAERGEGGADPWSRDAGTLAGAARGQLLACQHAATVSADELSATPQYRAHGWVAAHGYERYVIQYASDGPAGIARRVSAVLYLPSGAGPFPIVAVNHGTNGVGPGCGPSHVPQVADYMALPLVGRGYAVVATDYLGMGVDEGVYAYGVGDAEARGILDGIRALRRFDDPPRFARASLEDRVFLLGHSQGGQATLLAHAAWDPSVGTLLGSVTLAPGLGDLRGLDLLLGPRDRPMDATLLFLTMVLYSSASYVGAPAAKDWLTAAGAAQLPGLLHDRCWVELATELPARFPTAGALFAPSFLDAAATCPFGDASCPAFSPWEGYLRAAVPGDFASDAPALVAQGGADTIVPPYTTACVIDRLLRRGTAVTSCGYAASTHYTIFDDAAEDVFAWLAARRAGGAYRCATPLAATCP